VDFRTETLRTKLERVHFGSGIETRVFFSGKKKSIIMKMRVDFDPVVAVYMCSVNNSCSIHTYIHIHT
jgi:hypothetical protein